ncbi:carbohydrate ABC transporter permease [Anaerosporobacter faecicola]|uniref:carbohydrate ABC transporter permease n=1 Tax=Anaerosporobacter faecicola TaxID=2718714 RepID=UPI00143C96C6|nr:carbohydrate ABC transporter permease [Anaerosporobacter faecicola]
MAKNHIGGTKTRIKNIGIYTLLVLVFLLYMFPFIFIVINSLKTKKEIIKTPLKLLSEQGLNFDNFVKAYEKMDFAKAFTNSMFVTLSATVIVIILAAMTAYYYVRVNNLLSKIFFSLMVASMIIPFQAIMIPLVSIYGAKLGMLNSRVTLIFMHVGFAISMSVFIFHGFIKSNIPIALEEAAYIDGCSRTKTFFKIIFPLLKPTTATLVILNVLAFWNDFLLPSLVLTKEKLLTLPLSTYKFYGTYSADLGTIMAALVLTVAPILILYVFLQKYIISGVVSGAVKS